MVKLIGNRSEIIVLDLSCNKLTGDKYERITIKRNRNKLGGRKTLKKRKTKKIIRRK